MEPTVSTNPPAGGPAVEPATDFGWTRTYEFGGPGLPRVAWNHPGLVAGSFRVHANANGVALAGQFFIPPSLVPNLRSMLALAARVSRQLAAGTKLDALDFSEEQPHT